MRRAQLFQCQFGLKLLIEEIEINANEQYLSEECLSSYWNIFQFHILVYWQIWAPSETKLRSLLNSWGTYSIRVKIHILEFRDKMFHSIYWFLFNVLDVLFSHVCAFSLCSVWFCLVTSQSNRWSAQQRELHFNSRIEVCLLSERKNKQTNI